MSSPCDVTMYNFTNTALTAKVLVASWIENDGASINGRTVSTCASGTNRTTARVTAKTGHDGTLQVQLVDGRGQVAGTYTIESLKDPQNGEKSLQVASQNGYVFSSMGYRNSPNDTDVRRVDVVVADCS